MSVFRNIRIYPSHGTRTATITWEIAPNVKAGDVFVAYSPTGVPESWVSRQEEDEGVPSETRFYDDTDFVVDQTYETSYYRLLLKNEDGNFLSEKIGIIGDLSPQEFALVRAMIHREYTMMRTGNGYPVWHCIPKQSGELSPLTDPDTMLVEGLECADAENPSYGLPYAGGFHPPLLTWLRPNRVIRGSLKDNANDYGPRGDDGIEARLMAYPAPSLGHMFVDPSTDRRYLVGEDITIWPFKGVFPVAYDVRLSALMQNDPRYRFQMPVFDPKAYRRLPYWKPSPTP